MSICPDWTSSSSVYPNWIGFTGIQIVGDIYVFRNEQRLAGMDYDFRLLMLVKQFILVSLDYDHLTPLLAPESRRLTLMYEEKIQSLSEEQI